MDQVTVPRELLRQFLDEAVVTSSMMKAYSALRAALEQTVQEPYGYYFRDDPRKFAMPGTGFRLGSTPPSDVEVCIPLYTAPQAQQEEP